MKALAGLETERLYDAVLERGVLPVHVAIIMDGNGRWAKKRHLPRVAGHRAGRYSVRACVTAAGRLGLKALTLYTFSQENFNRPEPEVRALWAFLQETLAAEQADLKRRDVRLLVSGNLEQLPDTVRERLTAAIEYLAGNQGLILNLALAYGGRQEILHAALGLARRLSAGELQEDQVDEKVFAEGLYTPELPDPDLVVRTSGESRLSNFLLWQSAYSELLVTPTLWPDFREREFLLAVAEFQRRERRFGSLPSGVQDSSETAKGSIWDPARWKQLLRVKS